MVPKPEVEAAIREGVLKGEYALPFYGDFPAMSDVERRATWNLMLGEESTTKIIIDTFNKGGYDPSRDLLQSYKFIEGASMPQWRDAGFGGGVLVDWNLKTSLDGLYAAGDQMFAPEDHSYCAATGRYAGRKAAAYAREVGEPKLSRDQVAGEKARIYAPVKRSKRHRVERAARRHREGHAVLRQRVQDRELCFGWDSMPCGRSKRNRYPCSMPSTRTS